MFSSLSVYHTILQRQHKGDRRIPVTIPETKEDQFLSKKMDLEEDSMSMSQLLEQPVIQEPKENIHCSDGFCDKGSPMLHSSLPEPIVVFEEDTNTNPALTVNILQSDSQDEDDRNKEDLVLDATIANNTSESCTNIVCEENLETHDEPEIVETSMEPPSVPSDALESHVMQAEQQVSVDPPQPPEVVSETLDTEADCYWCKITASILPVFQSDSYIASGKTGLIFIEYSEKHWLYFHPHSYVLINASSHGLVRNMYFKILETKVLEGAEKMIGIVVLNLNDTAAQLYAGQTLTLSGRPVVASSIESLIE